MVNHRPSYWQDRRVIVAGGTAGFGLTLARHLDRAGARVLIVGRASDGVQQALAACEPRPGEPHPQRMLGTTADFIRPGEGNRVVGEARRLLGGVDDLFFCVGQSGRGAILKTSVEELRDSFQANVSTAVEITQAVADNVAAAHGHLVYIGSLAGKLVTPFMGSYCVAKSALAAYVDAVRLELTPHGAHVLRISPGPIRRDAADPRAAEAADRYAADITRAGLPAAANTPGGTASLAPLDPDRLAEQVLAACRRRQSELVVPRKAGLLAGLIEWCPDWGRSILARAVDRRG